MPMNKITKKAKYKFRAAAIKEIKLGMPVEELKEFAQQYDGITEAMVEEVYKATLIESEYYSKDKVKVKTLQMSRSILEIEYNNLDIEFLKQNQNLVVVQRGENSVFYEYVGGVYKQLLDVEIEYRIDKFMIDKSLFAYRTKKKILDCIARISSVLSRTQSRYFNDKYIMDQKYRLNLKNGLLDMETFKLTPHTHTYFSTFQAPFEYDPAATCPEFEKFIKTISNGDESTARMMQDMFGYCMGTNRNPKHKVFYLYGDTARNGKSTLAKILCGLIGESNYSTLSLAQLTSDSSSIVTALVGKHLNFSDEVSSKYIDSSALTTMSAEGIIQVNPKYKQPFNYQIVCKFIITCNDLPRFRDSQGMRYRLISIPFNYQIPEGDRIERYDEVLLSKEGSGILNWAITGIKQLRKTGTFTINEQSQIDAHENKLQSNSVYAFLEDTYDFSEEFTEEISVNDMYGAKQTYNIQPSGYNAFCFDTGVSAIAKIPFSKELKRYANETKLIQHIRKNDGSYYTGLKMKPGPFDDLTQKAKAKSDHSNGIPL